MTNEILKEFVQLVIEQQQETQGQTSSPVQVYLDMDGVLADFDKAIYSNKDYLNSKQTLNNVLKGMPELAKLSEDELKVRLRGPQKDPGLKALKSAFENYRSKKYEIAGKDGFFLNLEEMPGAKELINGVTAITGVKPNILTAPIQSSRETCEKEKSAWMQQHFGGLYNKFFCDLNKAKYAQRNPGNILIDDREKYTGPWERAGGTAIFYKGNASAALSELKKIVAVNSVPPEAIVGEQMSMKSKNKELEETKPLKVVSYTALVLSRKEHNRLLQLIPPPEGWEKIAHHVTLNMGPWNGDPMLLGKTFPIQVISHCQNDMVSACRVALSDEVKTKNDVPHITMSVNRVAGAKPFMSNKLDWTTEGKFRGTVMTEGTLIEVSQADNNKFSDEY